MQRFWVLLGLAGMVLGAVMPAKADLILSLPENTEVAVGQPVTIDVLIHSNNADHLGAFGVVFQVERVSGAGQLEFSYPLDPLLDPTLGDLNYVFSGFSGKLDIPDVLGVVPEGGANDRFEGFDLHKDFGFVELGDASSPALLARLPLIAGAFAPQAGDIYQIRLLDTDPGTWFETEFDEDFGYAMPLSLSDTSRLAGTITFTNAAVPEPSSALILCGSGFCLVFLRRIRVSALHDHS